MLFTEHSSLKQMLLLAHQLMYNYSKPDLTHQEQTITESIFQVVVDFNAN